MSSPFIKRSACQVCNSQDKQELYSVSYADTRVRDYLQSYYAGAIPPGVLDGGSYTINECRSCRCVWQENVLNDEYSNRLYDEWIPPEQCLETIRQLGATYFFKKALSVYLMILGTGKTPHTLEVLDYGMGWGHWCAMAKAFGCQAHGLELSKARIDHATNSGINVLTSLEQLSARRFDFVMLDQVLEHLPRPQETLSIIGQCLKPDGVVYVSVPPEDSHIADRLKKENPFFFENMKSLHPLEHINSFTKENLVRIGERSGLKVWRPARNRGKGAVLSRIIGSGENVLRTVFRRSNYLSQWFTPQGNAYVQQ